MQVEGVNGRGGVGASGEEGLGAAEEGSGEDDDGGGAVLMLAPRRERGGERSGDWLPLLAPRRSSSSSTVPGLSPLPPARRVERVGVGEAADCCC